MKRLNTILLLVFILTLGASCKNDRPALVNNTQLDTSKFYDVILMAGQSNMVGLGDIRLLDKDTLPGNVVYFNHGTDTELNILNSTFGPEVSLSRHLNERYPDRNFVLIKYAVGGSSIKDWIHIDNPNEENNAGSTALLDELKDFTETNLKDFKYRIHALLWSQGETEAVSETLSQNYESHFSHFIEDVRLKFNNPNLPIIYTEVSAEAVNPKAKAILNTALLNISKTSPHTYFTRTNDLELQPDSLHFSESALLKLGERFGTILENVLVLERDI